ncbi:COG4648 family protein [Teichococcus oryzae]|uniref:Transmembrane protein n=1 Tax=Teichococcus oryzae TaxID=1608942 RepID=A0A5B2TG11_9PROT|nr:hypothetical protein [Pseudoroseomonas oryzae]KAA2213053.1 hypothetical protein F0Q34_10425 [Pseudoroseomonas oryzae]
MALAVVAARLAGLPQLALLIALPALALAATRGQNWRRQMFFAALAMLAALLWWFLAPEPGLGAALLMPAGDLLMCWHFGATLRPGREALISHYTRHDFGYLPPECASYTRRLTAIWAALFLLLAPLHAALLLGVPPLPRCDSGLVLGATLGFTLLMFLGEHVIRSLRFPQHGIATPARTLRAIRSAHSSRPQPQHHD